MLRVQDKYLFRDCARGQYVVQCDCGLNHMEHTFSVSPLYFGYSKYEKLGQKIKKIKVEAWLEYRMVF